MAVNDDLAAVGHLDFENAFRNHRKIKISVAAFKTGFDALQRGIGQGAEFTVVHPVLPFFIYHSNAMRRFATLTVLLPLLALSACGTRGPLTLPPTAKATLAQATPSPTLPTDLNTTKEPAL